MVCVRHYDLVIVHSGLTQCVTEVASSGLEVPPDVTTWFHWIEILPSSP